MTDAFRELVKELVDDPRQLEYEEQGIVSCILCGASIRWEPHHADCWLTRAAFLLGKPIHKPATAVLTAKSTTGTTQGH